ncbi:uncharacterized protein LOC134837743 [Culicoides brevitarsis]|uniref:uncharacterized protein LOC134837743 n=1 Tax=Culicoides brevitarsis TaxID=469753 RepID=UPI00307B5D2E
MPNSSAKKKITTPLKLPTTQIHDNSDDSSESELQIDVGPSFRTPDKKKSDTKRSPPTSNRKKKRRRIRKSSTGEDEKLDLAIEDIEDTIQSCIQKNKELTPEAIKIILRKLVKNEHVLAICRLKEEELQQKCEEKGNEADDENDELLPKLTRAKAKQMDKKLLPLVPLKQPQPDNEVVDFLAKEINDDDETDPEYQPEEDPNTTISDMDSLPATPQSIKKPEMEILVDGVFKMPRVRNESLTQSEGEAEPICKRTRTRLCLETTPIETLESTLVAPDITVDMYDIDKDVDQHWADFLNEFARPFNPNADDDDPNDPEFQPAEVVPLDKEELANVAISKTEYNTLVKELMEIVDTMDASIFDQTVVENPQPPPASKEVERKIRSPRSIRKKTSNGLNESAESQKHQDLHTPTPLDDSQITFVPNLMSTINQSTIVEVQGDTSIFNETVISTETTKSAIVDTKSMINLSIQNPVNGDQWISLDRFNLLSYATLQDGVYYLPPTQKIMIEVPTDQLLKSMSPQADTKIILSDSIQSGSFNNSAIQVNESSLIESPSLVDDTNSTKYGKIRPLKQYEMLDFSPPTQISEKNETFGFTMEQKEILDQQLRMHAQLATQNFLQTYSHPQYWQDADVYSNFLGELESCTRWSEQHAAVQGAINLCQEWKKDVDGPAGKFVVDWFYKEWDLEKQGKEVVNKWYRPQLCPKIMEMMISHPVFAFPKLLPEIAFKSDYNTEKNKTEFMTGEEMLITFGLDTFSKQRKEEVERLNKSVGKVKWKVTIPYLSEKISLNLVKCRTAKAIYEKILHFKNSTTMSPIKYWLKYEVTPKVIYKITPLSMERTLKETPESLNNTWRQFIVKKDLDAEEQKKKSGKNGEISLDEQENIENLYGAVIKKQRKPKRKPLTISTETSGDFKIELSLNYDGENLIYEQKPAELKVTSSGNEEKDDDEEDLPLEERLKRLKRNSGELKKAKRGPKPTAKTYANTLKPIIPDFIKNLNYSNRKFDQARIGRSVIRSKILKIIYEKFKTLEIFTACLNELKFMAASPQNIKKMVKPTASTEKKKVVPPENEAVFAQNFFEKVEETLLNANKFEEFEKFAQILKTFDPSKERVADLYYKMEKIFHPHHPELLSLFLNFLEPGQAMQVGKFFEHFIMTNMSTFLEKLNKYFVKQPSQIKKIYNCLNELSNVENVTIEMVKESILPLLKGNPLLIDWFQQMFATEKPIDCNEADSETINWKKTTLEDDSTGVYEELVLSDVPSKDESPACGVRYFQGNIMYSGRTFTLPAKISFLAYETVVQMEKKEMAARKNKSMEATEPKDGTNCCHAIKTFADTRLTEKSKTVGNEKDTNSSHSSDEVENNLAGEGLKVVKKETTAANTSNGKEDGDGYYSTDDEQPKLADANTLKVHAIRLNPAVHARNGESFADMSHLLTSPQNVVEKYFSDDTKSPTKKSSSSSTSVHIASKTSKKLLMSPKAASKILKSPPQARKSSVESVPENSAALNTGKRLKNLCESDRDSDLDCPLAASRSRRNKKVKSRKISDTKKPEDVEQQTKETKEKELRKSPVPSTSGESIKNQPEASTSQENATTSTVSTNSEETIPKNIEKNAPVTVPWTREEDKYILEEQRKGYESVAELVSRLTKVLTNRTSKEVNERFDFLMDLLRKIQQKS